MLRCNALRLIWVNTASAGPEDGLVIVPRLSQNVYAPGELIYYLFGAGEQAGRAIE